MRHAIAPGMRPGTLEIPIPRPNFIPSQLAQNAKIVYNFNSIGGQVHLGIKIGPNGWRDKLDNKLNIRHVEVFFDLERLPQYEAMFAWLRAHGIAARLHSSTRLAGGGSDVHLKNYVLLSGLVEQVG